MTIARRSLLTLATFAALGTSLGVYAWGSSETVRGDGKIAKESRKVEGFDAIGLSGPFELKVRQSGSPRVELEADGNLLQYVETKIKGRTLEIQVKKGYALYSKQPLKIEVDMASLRSIGIAGSGKAEVESMKSEKISFEVAGSGAVMAPKLEASSIKLDIAGSGDIKVGGKANELYVSIAGSGDVKAGDLVADEVKVDIAGSGDATVQANKKLKASIAGSGDVRYTGNAEVNSSIAGSGSVKRL